MNMLKKFIREEDAVGVVEIILILVILIALVMLFKKEITSIVKKAFESIKTDSDSIIAAQ